MKKYLLAATALTLAACATQDPAPVLSGQSRMPWEPKLSKVETPIAIEHQVRQQQALKQAGDSYSLTNRQQHTQPQIQQLAAAKPTRVLPRTVAVPTFQAEDLGRIEPAAGPSNTNTQLFANPAVTAAPAAPVVTTATPRVATHHVIKGDTMYSLSRKHGTTVAGLMAANNKTSPSLSVGEILLVPNTTVPVAAPAPVQVAVAPVQAAPVQAAPVVVPATAPAQRYSLTRKTQTVAAGSQPQLASIQRAAAIEPAAGATHQPATLPTVKANTTARTHQVQAGETLYRIGKQYGVTPIDLMAANSFQKPQDLIAGTQIRIPGRTADAVAKPVAVVKDVNEKLAKAKGFVWPAEGKILASYGQQGTGINHTGINIALPENTPVRAAESGTVIYADDGLKSYGNLVLIRHADGLVTAYAHNNQLVAKKDDKVQKGQTIALSGKTGNVTTPQLHFEVRRNAQAINPLNILPKSSVASR